jgi:hypothetical protein
MAASTSAGSTLAISIGVPASQDGTGYAALTYTDIGNLEKIGTVGASYAKTEFQPFQGAKQKFKGSADYGSLAPTLAHDEADAGQAILRAAADDETNRLYAFALTYPTGAKRYFQARVFGYPEAIDGADTVLMATPTIEICTKVVKTGAGTPTPTPAPTFSGNPTISPTSGTTATTYTATDPTIANGTITTRAWLLGTTTIGTGPSIVPGVGNEGQLTRKVAGVGDDGSTITRTSAAVTVAAAAVTLNTLTVSVASATVGNAFSSTISGLTSGSSVALTGAGAAGLSISGAVITGTPTTAGTVNIVETLAAATNSPRTTSSVVTVAAASVSTDFTMTQLAAPNRVYQRSTTTGGSQNKGTGTIPVTINVATTGVPYFRIRSSDGTTILQASTALPALTSTGAQALNVAGVAARLGWFYVDLSADGTTWKNGTTLVGMGRIFGITGQSQAARLFGKVSATAETNASLGVAIDANSAVYARYTDPSRTLNTPAWAIPADGTNYDSTFSAEFLRRQVAYFGVNCAQVGHANGGTKISDWLPGTTNNTNLRAVLDAVGGFEAYYWNQGGDDAGASTSAASYQASLTTFFNDVTSRNTIRGTSFEKYVTTMGTRLAGGVGTTATVQTIRKAALDWSAANGASYIEPHDITLEDAVHQTPTGNIPIARALHRATTTATNNGPTLVSGTRSGTSITLTTSAAVSVVGNPTDRFTIYASGTSSTALAVASLSASGTTITVNLTADPGSGQALDVHWLRHPDPSGTTAAQNIIYDTYTADGIPNGRQLQPTLSGPVVIAAPTPTPTPAATLSDTFTGADGTDMTARTSDTGQTYSRASGATGSIVINNNEAATGDTLGSVYLSNYAPTSANYTVSAKFKCVSVVADAACYILGRLSMSGTSRTNYQAGYSKVGFAPYSAEGIYLGKTVGGTFTALGFYAYTAVAGAAPVIAMKMDGTALTVTLDGATVITATDGAITGAGTVGMRFTGQTSPTTGFHLDNLAASAIVVAPAKAAKVTFSKSNTPPAGFNAFYGLATPTQNANVGRTKDLSDTTGAALGWTITSTNFCGANDTNGTSTGSNSGLYPDAAMLGYIYNGLSAGGENAGVTVPSTTLTVSGLNPAKTYTFIVFGSRAATDRQVVFTAGGTDKTVDCSSNTTRSATFAGLTPNSSGVLTLAFAPLTTTGYGYLNVMEIIEG